MADIFQHPYYRFNKFLLCCAGLWPYHSRAKRLVLLAFIGSIATVQMIAQDFDVFTETTPPFVIFLSTTISIIIDTINSDKILKMFQQIEIDWIYVTGLPEMHILRGYVAKGKQFTIVPAVYIKSVENTTIVQLFFLVGACLATFLYLSQPFLFGFQKFMELSNETTSKSLPIPADYFGLDIDVYYDYILAYMYIFCLYGVLMAVAVESTFVILVQHACGMFAVVGHQLQRMANDITEEFAELNSQPKMEPAFRQIIVCIKKHNDVIEFSKTLEAVTTWIFLPIFGITVLVISISGFQTLLMMDKNPKGAIRYVAFPMVMISHQFILSVFSQKLMDHSQRISEYLYQAEWYKTSLATQKLLSLVIMRSHVPCQITAGKIVIMSMENFAAALKASMSYVAVMRSMQ